MTLSLRYIIAITFVIAAPEIIWAQSRSSYKQKDLRSVQNKVEQLLNLDTLKSQSPTIDSSQVKLMHVDDDLNLLKSAKINLDSPKISEEDLHVLHADTIQNKLNTVVRKSTTELFENQTKLKSKVDSVKIIDDLENRSRQLNIKTKLIQLPNAEGTIDQPGFLSQNLFHDIPLPTESVVMPSKDLPNTNLPVLPDVKLTDQQINIHYFEVPSTDANILNEKLPTELPKLSVPDSAKLEEFKGKALEDERLKKYAAPVSEVTHKIDPYKKNLDSLSWKDAATIAEKEAESAIEHSAIAQTFDNNIQQGRAALAGPDLAMLQRYQDKKVLQEEMLRKSKAVMNDKITSATPQFKEQQKNFGKAKKLNGSVASVKNIKVKRSDPLRERPFYERIVPGLAMQTYAGKVFAIDFAPQLGYRISSPWLIGAGALYRVGFDKKYSTFISGQGVSGFRSFINYRLVKGLFVHVEYEKITVNKRFDYSDRLVTPAFNSTYLGLGKRYAISRKFNGSLIALYKLEMNDHLPGTTKFNLRVVIEYKTKKKRKPTDL